LHGIVYTYAGPGLAGPRFFALDACPSVGI
jgi:hypothetical protein